MSLEQSIKDNAKKFLEKSKEKEILVVSHFDTDGISSAAIMTKALKELDLNFSVKIMKGLEKEDILSLPKNKIILFLDLASGSLHHLEESELKDIFIIDHHEIIYNIPSNVTMINPDLHEKQKLSASALTYLFCKEISKTTEIAKLAVLGMIGDCLDKELDKLNHGILEDNDIKRKRGVLIYPSTRPLNRALEFSSSPFIPGVTGDIKGVMDLIREAGIGQIDGRYKSLLELDEKEMTKLTTAIMLRLPHTRIQELVGDIFLLKFFNKLEDARELSAKINACSRMGEPQTALQLCLEIASARKRSETIYTKYKQEIVAGLKHIEDGAEKYEGKGYLIINAKQNISETIIGTMASILSNSTVYEPGKIIVTMGYFEEKIKISARVVADKERNLREMLNCVITEIGGEVGGHKSAAGCVISRDKEKDFLDTLKRNLEIETIKIN